MSTRAPGALLFHPLAIASLFVLVFNDHYLKAAWPSALSGKLSDFAGLFLAPLVAFSAFELAVARCASAPLSRRRANGALALIAAATAIGFALPEIWEPADRAYRYGMACLRFPFRALASVVMHGALPEFRPVIATADVTDLVALPMAYAAYRLAALREQRAKLPRVAFVAPAALVVLASLTHARPCAADLTDRAAAKDAARKRTFQRHDGFFAEASLGGGLLYVDSAASVSNGFLQRVPSTATGASAPVLSVAAGGTMPQGFVIGLRVNVGGANAPAISTLGERFSVYRHNLEFVVVTAFVRFYPDPTDGLFFGAGPAYLSLQASDGEDSFDSYPIGDQQGGIAGLLEGGYGLWIAKQFSVSASLQLTAGRVSGHNGASFVFAPHLFAGITWH